MGGGGSQSTKRKKKRPAFKTYEQQPFMPVNIQGVCKVTEMTFIMLVKSH